GPRGERGQLQVPGRAGDEGDSRPRQPRGGEPAAAGEDRRGAVASSGTETGRRARESSNSSPPRHHPRFCVKLRVEEKKMTQIADPTPAVPGSAETTEIDSRTLPFSLSLRWPESLRRDDDWLLSISQENPDLRFEYTAEGELIIMSPNIPDGSDRNAELIFQ